MLKYPFLQLDRFVGFYYKTLFLFGFVRIDEESLGEASPVLARLFLQSIFISVDIRIREGHLFCDTLCANGPLYNGQVSYN